MPRLRSLAISLAGVWAISQFVRGEHGDGRSSAAQSQTTQCLAGRRCLLAQRSFPALGFRLLWLCVCDMGWLTSEKSITSSAGRVGKRKAEVSGALRSGWAILLNFLLESGRAMGVEAFCLEVCSVPERISQEGRRWEGGRRGVDG